MKKRERTILIVFTLGIVIHLLALFGLKPYSFNGINILTLIGHIILLIGYIIMLIGYILETKNSVNS